MKLYISADIEGVNGILDWTETSLSHARYEQFRQEMIREVNAACKAAKNSGAKEIFIKDAHDSASNLIIEKLPLYVKLVRGWSGHPFSMMQELDQSFDAVIFIGYHSASRSDNNPLSHTNTSRYHYIKFNGDIVSEYIINSYIASYVNVPVVFVSGDLNLCQQAKKFNPSIQTVVTNQGIGKSIICAHPDIIEENITNQISTALKSDLNQCLISLPKEFEVEICFKEHYNAYKASFYPGVVKIDTDTILFKTNDYFEVLRMLMFII